MDSKNSNLIQTNIFEVKVFKMWNRFNASVC